MKTDTQFGNAMLATHHLRLGLGGRVLYKSRTKQVSSIKHIKTVSSSVFIENSFCCSRQLTD